MWLSSMGELGLKILVCLTEQTPCPPESMAWVDILAGLGLDHETVLLIFSYGFAPVLACFLLGYSIGLAKGLINKI